MTLISFKGGPQDGNTRDLPVTTGEPITFKRESGAVEYEFTGGYGANGARVYRVKDAPPVAQPTEWPQEEKKPVKRAPRPRRTKEAGTASLRAAFKS